MPGTGSGPRLARRQDDLVLVNVAAFAVTGFVDVGKFSDGAAWLPGM